MPTGRTFLLRRHFSVHQASRRGGWAGTLEFVFDPRGPGTEWLSEVRAHRFLDVIGPLGKPRWRPAERRHLLVSEGTARSPYFLAQELRERGKRVDMLVGAETQDRVFKPIETKRLAQSIVLTEDGTLGEQGSVLDLLPQVVESTGAQVVYAAARRSTLRGIAEFCGANRIPSQWRSRSRWRAARAVLRLHRAGDPQGRVGVRQPPRVHGGSRLQLGARPVGALDGRPAAATPTPPEGFPVARSWPG